MLNYVPLILIYMDQLWTRRGQNIDSLRGSKRFNPTPVPEVKDFQDEQRESAKRLRGAFSQVICYLCSSDNACCHSRLSTKRILGEGVGCVICNDTDAPNRLLYRPNIS